eukprot:3278939-Rhodomonas_salina.1
MDRHARRHRRCASLAVIADGWCRHALLCAALCWHRAAAAAHAIPSTVSWRSQDRAVPVRKLHVFP